jgi:NitT/TauT family transport system substrate-binding protein
MSETKMNIAHTMAFKGRAQRDGRLRPYRCVLGVICCLVLAVGGISNATNASAGSSSSTKLTKVSAILGWYAEPARAGFYAAQKLGYYKAAGLDVNLIAGADVSPEQVVGSGRAEFGYDDGDAIAQSVSKSIPIEGIAASFQTFGFILLYHKNSGIHGFRQLSNRTVYIFPGSFYWEYIVKKYHLTGVKQVAYTGSLQPFLTSSASVNQGYLGVENYTASKHGIAVGHLLVAKSGYNPYSNVIFTMKSYAAAHPALVRAFVDATVKGWNAYKTDYKAIDKYMNQFNKGFSAAAMDANAVAQESLVFGGDARSHGVGYMSPERWRATVAHLLYIGAMKKALPVSSMYTNAFLLGHGR